MLTDNDMRSSVGSTYIQKPRILAYCLVVSVLLLATYQSNIRRLPDNSVRGKSTEYRDLATGNFPYDSALRTVTSQLLAINDPTMQPDPTIDRPWLFDSSVPQPPYKLILTDIGWNHPNKTYGLEASRSMRSKELLQGMLDHPNFDPNFVWSQVVDGSTQLDENTRYYVFLDVETCFESNYPVYGAATDGFLANADLAGGRTYTRANNHPCYNINECHYIHDTLTTIYKHPNSLLVVYNCRGWGPGPLFRTKEVPTKQLSLVSESASFEQVNPDIDQGLTPGPLNVVELSSKEIDAINSCNDTERPFLVTFVGMPKQGPRDAMLRNMSNGRDALFMTKRDFQNKYFFLTFHESLKKSKFGAAPKGDNLYSYRFTEVLSSGAIPVVHADDWVLPFHKALFDWNETCAIILPEATVYETERILRSISKEEICRRQRNCLDIYHKYFATPQGTVRGIIEALERIYEQDATPLSPY